MPLRCTRHPSERSARIEARTNARAPGGDYDLSNPVGSFVDVMRRVVARPAEFFAGMLRRGNYVPPLVFALICIEVFTILGGLRGGAAGAAYTASKHDLIGLTKNTAANYAADGIRCVAICPGGVDTGIGPGGGPSERGYATLNRILPAMPRLASPAEMANVALFCASDEASYPNGAVIVADGGWTAH